MVEAQAVESKVREWLQVKAFHARHPEAGTLNFIYQMVKAGDLLSVKLGGRVLIASDALNILAEQQRGADLSTDPAPRAPVAAALQGGSDAFKE